MKNYYGDYPYDSDPTGGPENPFGTTLFIIAVISLVAYIILLLCV